ncbi:hypothetical protein [Bosea massiliensis]|uniref:Phage tail tape measure protein domain-containing protein n=1 Tax=Bosea massiliensis TaxID=151419 RepID=A0ABW0PCK8_9HYPH
MAPRSILAQLVVALRDDASGPAKALAGTLKGLEKSAVDFAKTMNGAKWNAGFTRQLGNLKATQDEIGQIKRSWGELQAQLSGAGAKGRLRTDAQKQWANEWLGRLQAVRIAQQQNTEEGIRNAKRLAAEEKRAAAEAAREKLRLTKEEARAKDRAIRETAANERRAARESARTAREAMREQARAVRVANRESARAQRDLARSERETGRGAGAFGRAVVRHGAYAVGVGGGSYLAARGTRAGAIMGAEGVRQDARDYQAGMTQAESDRLRALSIANSQRYKSVSETNLRQIYRESALSMGGYRRGGFDKVTELAPDLAAAMVSLQTKVGPQQASTQLAGLSRAAQNFGFADDPKRFREILEGLVRAQAIEGREFNFQDMFTLARRAKSAGLSLSDEFLYTVAPALIADQGAPGAGTALSKLIQRQVGGRVTKASMGVQRQYGIRDEKNNVVGMDTLIRDPFQWVKNVVIPKLQAKGINVDDPTQLGSVIPKLFSDETAAALVQRLIGQREEFEDAQVNYKRAPGNQAAAGELEKRDPFVAMQQVTQQIDNAATEIARPIVQTIMPALSMLGGSLNSLANKIRENPEFARTFGETGAGVTGVGGLGAIAGGLAGLWQSGTVAGAIKGGLRGGVWGALLGGVLGLVGPSIYRNLTDNPDQGSPAEGFNLNFDRKSVYDRARFNQDSVASQGRVAAGGAASEGQAAGESFSSSVASGVAAQAPAVEAQGRSIFDRLRAIFSSGITVPITAAPGGSEGHRVFQNVTGQGTAPARGSGGSVAAGGLYRVNEYGEEFFQPTEDGRIIDPRRKAAGGGAVVGSFSMGGSTFHITGVSDPGAVAERVIAEIDARVRDLVDGAFADVGVELA